MRDNGIMMDEDEDVVMNTHRNARVGFGTTGRPANYVQMRVMMSRIVEELKAAGESNPSNEQVMRVYSKRMREARG